MPLMTLLWFWVCAYSLIDSPPSIFATDFLSCYQPRNITMFVYPDRYESQLSLPQLKLLVKSLLETECTFLRLYNSRLERLVEISSLSKYDFQRHNEKEFNWQAFDYHLENNIKGISKTMDCLLKQNGQGQTILFFQLHSYAFSDTTTLQKLQNNAHYDVIMFCRSRNSKLCT